MFERRDQRPFAARIVGGEFASVEAGVGDVAAPAAGDFDLGKKLRGFFEDDDFRRASGSAQAIAAKNPAAPPPTITIRSGFMSATILVFAQRRKGANNRVRVEN